MALRTGQTNLKNGKPCPKYFSDRGRVVGRAKGIRFSEEVEFSFQWEIK